MSYLTNVAAGVLSVERAKMRRWSAVRRGTVVVLALVVFGLLYSPEVGALASVAALYVGLQDRNADPLRYTIRVMVTETMLLAGVAVLAGLASHTWVSSLVLVACAAMAGLVAQHDKALSRMFADVIAVMAFVGLERVDARTSVDYAIAIVIACAVQILLTRIAYPFQSDLAERRPVAAAFRATAAHLDDAQTRARRGTGEEAERALAAADASVVKSDLSLPRRRALRKLINDAEALREEASSLRTRRAFETAVIEELEVDEAVDLAITALQASARAITIVVRPGKTDARLDRELALLTEVSGHTRSIARDHELRPSARAIARRTNRLIKHVRRLLDTPEDHIKDQRPRIRQQLLDDLRRPAPADLRSAGRLALAAFVSLLLAHALNLEHGGWVAATSVALLRPDYRALTVDTVARAVGTAIGAAAVVPLVWITLGEEWAEVAMVALLAVATFAVTAANEGLFVVAITVETVFTRAAVGEDPISAATTRMLDVFLGCLIAVVLLLVLPLRHGRRVKHELRDYAAATSDWLGTLAVLAENGSAKGLKKRHSRMRVARVGTQHSLDVRKVEPLGTGIPPWLGQNLFGQIHDVERSAGAAEASLLHGATPTPRAAEYARRAAADLAVVVAIIDGHTPTPPVADAEDPSDLSDIESLLAVAAREAAGARLIAGHLRFPTHTGGSN